MASYVKIGNVTLELTDEEEQDIRRRLNAPPIYLPWWFPLFMVVYVTSAYAIVYGLFL